MCIFSQCHRRSPLVWTPLLSHQFSPAPSPSTAGIIVPFMRCRERQCRNLFLPYAMSIECVLPTRRSKNKVVDPSMLSIYQCVCVDVCMVVLARSWSWLFYHEVYASSSIIARTSPSFRRMRLPNSSGGLPSRTAPKSRIST